MVGAIRRWVEGDEPSWVEGREWELWIATMRGWCQREQLVSSQSAEQSTVSHQQRFDTQTRGDSPSGEEFREDGLALLEHCLHLLLLLGHDDAGLRGRACAAHAVHGDGCVGDEAARQCALDRKKANGDGRE